MNRSPYQSQSTDPGNASSGLTRLHRVPAQSSVTGWLRHLHDTQQFQNTTSAAPTASGSAVQPPPSKKAKK